MTSEAIGILLGVYNGARFLEDQIQSYVRQSHDNWLVLARDDGSADSSGRILDRYALADSRFHVIKDGGENLGVVSNFAALMDAALHTACEYFVFSDQDDHWHPEKLASQLQLMKETEDACPGRPVLVHSDAVVADAGLNVICPSLMTYQGINHNSRAPLKNLLVQNFVTGCTVMANRRLIELACPVPGAVVMHDWWLALCAAAFGRIEFIDRPLLHYRQHRHNRVGAKSFVRHLNPLMGRWLYFWESGRRHLARSVFQAGALYCRMAEQGGEGQDACLVKAYASLLEMPPPARICFLLKQGIGPQTFRGHSLMISRLFFISRGNGGSRFKTT